MADDELGQQPFVPQTDKRDQLLLDLEGLLSRPEGRRVMMWFLGLCGIYDMQFTGNNDATNFTLGKREPGIRVIGKLNELSPTTYPQLLLQSARDTGEKKEKPYVADEE
jgi:hypothetical protein